MKTKTSTKQKTANRIKPIVSLNKPIAWTNFPIFGEDIFPNNSVWIIGVGTMLIIFGLLALGGF